MKGFGSLTITLLLAIVAVTYYAVVFANYGPELFGGGSESATSSVILILFHAFLIMLLWSYFATVFTDPGGVPPNWRPEIDEEKEENITTPLIRPKIDEQTVPNNYRELVRYCRKCNRLKPPRCHHCSVCGRCVLRMDHHCPWVSNCVGARNYKYFFLLLVYTFLETSLVISSLLPHIVFFFGKDEVSGAPVTIATTIIGFVLNLFLGLFVLVLLVVHIFFVARNKTTIEQHERKTNSVWIYDLGRGKNFEQVFGRNKLFWLIPTYSEEDLRRMPVLSGLSSPQVEQG